MSNTLSQSPTFLPSFLTPFAWTNKEMTLDLLFIILYFPNFLCGRATLVLELVKGGEKTLRDSLGMEGVHTAKLNDSICAQLCDTGMQALERATRSVACLLYFFY